MNFSTIQVSALAFLLPLLGAAQTLTIPLGVPGTTGWKGVPHANSTLAQAMQNPPTMPTASPQTLMLNYGGPALASYPVDIQNIVKACQSDAKKLYDVVYNNVKFQPYYGFRKGAVMTWLTRSGNDADQAELLVTLLRAAGYEAEFAYGVLEMPTIDYLDWWGADQVDALNSMTGSAGYWAGISGPTTYAMEQYWVVLTYEQNPYSLHPGFKRHTVSAGISISGATGYNRAQFLSAAGGIETATEISGLSENNTYGYLNSCALAWTNTISTQHANASMDEVIGARVITPANLTNYLNGFPNNWTIRTEYPHYTFSNVEDVFDDRAYIVVAVGIPNGNGGLSEALVQTYFPTSEVLGKPLTVKFTDDLRAQIFLDGALVTEEVTYQFPESVALAYQIYHPYKNVNYNQLRAVPVNYTGIYTYVLDMGGFDQSEVTRRRQLRLEEYQRNGLASNSREVIEESLYLLGYDWSKQFTLAQNLMAQMGNWQNIIHHTVNLVSQEAGFSVDIPSTQVPISRDAIGTTVAQTTELHKRAMLMIGSSMEHGVIEQNYPTQSAVSTVRYMRENHAMGHRTFYATNDNYSTIANDVGFINGWSDYYRLGLFPYLLDQGHILVIPQNGAITLGDLTGTGYFEITPSGVSAIIEPGALNGGYSTVIGQVDFTQNPTPPNPLPHPSNLTNPTSKEPIDMLSGAYLFNKTDLAIDGAGVRGLTLSRGYSSHAGDSPNEIGKGWFHNYQISVREHSDTVAAFGGKTPAEAANAVVATQAILDLVALDTSPKAWLTSSLTAYWLMLNTRTGATTVSTGGNTSTFIRQANNTFISPAGTTSTLMKDSGTGLYRLEERFGQTLYFNANLTASGIVDADGKTLQFTYNTSGAAIGKLHTVADAYGRTLTFTYHDTVPQIGLVATVTDSTNRTTQYQYTADKRLYRVTDPENNTQQFGYGTDGRLSQLYNANGELMAENVFDEYGRVITQTAEADEAQTWEYGFTGLSSIEFNPVAQTTTYQFDTKGRIVATTNGEGHTTSSEYDGQNHLVKMTDAKGQITRFEYDNAHNLRFVYDARNGASGTTYKKEFQYDASFHRQFTIDEAGHSTEFVYDAEHHLHQIIDPLLRTTTINYYTSGLHDGMPQTIITAGNFVTAFTYDANGYPDTLTRADNSVTDFTYNARGDLEAVQISMAGDANTHTKTYTYDLNRRLESSMDAANHGSTYEYDSAGNAISLTDSAGNSTDYFYTPLGRVWGMINAAASPTFYDFDTAGRLQTTTDALGYSTSLEYDNASRLHQVAAPLGLQTTQSFDGADNLGTLINPNNKSYQWTYTATNKAESLTTPLNRQFDYTYNSRDLAEFVDEPSGQRTEIYYYSDGKPQYTTDSIGRIDFTYDTSGRLWKTTANGTDITRVYNSLDQLTSFTDANSNTISYTYDGAGNLTELTYPSTIGDVAYHYDNTDRLDYLTDWANRTTDFQYDTYGRLNKIILPNGTQRIYGYDFAGRLSYIRDEVTVTLETINEQSVRFDILGRIEHEALLPEPSEYIPSTVAMTYDDDDRLATWNGQTCVSDLDGNLTTGPLGGALETFTYDARNRLTEVAGTNYTYDAENRRTSQTVGGVTTTYIYDPNSAFSRLLQSTTNGVTTRYIYAGSTLLYEETNGVIRCYHADFRGSTLAITNASGSVVGRASYGPYGELVTTTGTLNTPFLYHGAYGVMTDSSGLYYMRARYYNPATRRFLNADPIGFGGGVNWFGFVGGNPIMKMDPLGLWNLFNPLTWGLPTQPGENSWNPGDDSAEWSATATGTNQGASAYFDGVIPFVDPFKDNYDNNDTTMVLINNLGALTREGWVAAAGGYVAKGIIQSGGAEVAAKYASMNIIQKTLLNKAILSQAFKAEGVLGQVQSAANITLQVVSAIDLVMKGRDLYDRIFGEEK